MFFVDRNNVNMATKVPLKAEEVTEEWLMGAMQDALKVTTVKVIALDPIKESGGFLTGAFKAQVKIEDGSTIRLFIKIGEDQFRKNMVHYNIDIAEVNAYTEYLPMLVKFEMDQLGKSELANLSPNLYAGGCSMEKDKRGFYLIMGDLTPDYRMIKTEDGLSLKQLNVTFRCIAQLHAVSYAYGQVKKVDFGPKLKSHFDFDKFMQDPNILAMLDSAFTIAIKDLEENPSAKHLAEPMANLSKHYQKPFMQAVDTTDTRFLIHGDLWSNNIMFNPDDSECRIFDWQFFTAASPINDFVIAAYSSADPKDSEAWLDEIFTTYFEKFSSACQELKMELPYDKEHFVNECLTKGFLGCLAFLLVAYEFICGEPKIVARFNWMLEMAIKHCPEHFQ
jgi:hypothetical protein